MFGKKLFVQRGGVNEAQYMARTTINCGKGKSPHFAGKEELFTENCSKLLKNPFFHFYQIFETKTSKLIGQSCFTTTYSPFFHKGVRRQSSYIDKNSRGLGFSKLMKTFFQEFAQKENFGIYYIQVHYKNYPQLKFVHKNELKRSIQFYDISPIQIFAEDFPNKLDDFKELMDVKLDTIIRDIDEKGLKLRSIESFNQKMFENLRVVWNEQEGFDAALQKFLKTNFEEWSPLINPNGSLTKLKITEFFKNIEPYKGTDYYNTQTVGILMLKDEPVLFVSIKNFSHSLYIGKEIQISEMIFAEKNDDLLSTFYAAIITSAIRDLARPLRLQTLTIPMPIYHSQLEDLREVCKVLGASINDPVINFCEEI